MLPPPLVALSPGNLSSASNAEFRARLVGALEAGLRGVLLREPRLADGAYLRILEEVHDEVAARGGWVAAHDRAHLARAAGVEAVHLGFRSLSPRAVRDTFGAALSIGLSTHAGDERRNATLRVVFVGSSGIRTGLDFVHLAPSQSTSGHSSE